MLNPTPAPISPYRTHPALPPTMLNEAGAEATPDALDELFAKLRRIARASSMVLFGGSLPPGVPADIYAKLIDIVHEVGVKAILDADGEPMVHGMKAVPFMVKPNREEAQRLYLVSTSNRLTIASKHWTFSGNLVYN